MRRLSRRAEDDWQSGYFRNEVLADLRPTLYFWYARLSPARTRIEA
jgi:hypothetical protein